MTSGFGPMNGRPQMGGMINPQRRLAPMGGPQPQFQNQAMPPQGPQGPQPGLPPPPTQMPGGGPVYTGQPPGMGGPMPPRFAMSRGVPPGTMDNGGMPLTPMGMPPQPQQPQGGLGAPLPSVSPIPSMAGSPMGSLPMGAYNRNGNAPPFDPNQHSRGMMGSAINPMRQPDQALSEGLPSEMPIGQRGSQNFSIRNGGQSGAY